MGQHVQILGDTVVAVRLSWIFCYALFGCSYRQREGRGIQRIPRSHSARNRVSLLREMRRGANVAQHRQAPESEHQGLGPDAEAIPNASGKY